MICVLWIILLATAEMEGISARVSPVGSAGGSQKNLNLNGQQQDMVSRATQQYLDVLKKNYMVWSKAKNKPVRRCST